MTTVHSALLKTVHSQLSLTRYTHHLAQSTTESPVSRSSFGLWDNGPQHVLRSDWATWTGPPRLGNPGGRAQG